MAVPMSAATLKKILQDEGLTVIEVKNWKTHNRNHKGSFGPVHGVMLHHTVTKGKESTVNICYTGTRPFRGRSVTVSLLRMVLSISSRPGERTMPVLGTQTYSPL